MRQQHKKPRMDGNATLSRYRQAGHEISGGNSPRVAGRNQQICAESHIPHSRRTQSERFFTDAMSVNYGDALIAKVWRRSLEAAEA